MPNLQMEVVPNSTAAIMTYDIAAPRVRVFACYVDPALLVQWLGPRRLRMEIAHHDARHGGSYVYRHYDDAGQLYLFRGVFHGDPSVEGGIMRTMEFMGAPGEVQFERLTLAALPDGGTRIRVHVTYGSVATRDMMVGSGMRAGMEDSMARMEELLGVQG